MQLPWLISMINGLSVRVIRDCQLFYGFYGFWFNIVEQVLWFRSLVQASSQIFSFFYLQVEEKETVLSLLKKSAEQSSLHGVGRIITCRHGYQKLLWLVVVLGLTGYLAYQLNDLFTSFLDHPVKTKVSLEFKELHFPAISFCNMNRVKAGVLKRVSDDLRKLLVSNKIVYFSFCDVYVFLHWFVLWYDDVRASDHDCLGFHTFPTDVWVNCYEI